MGLDYSLKFREPISIDSDFSTDHSPFSRGFSAFINDFKYKEDPILTKLEDFMGINLEFLTEPNYYEYEVDEMQLEFAIGEELLKLEKIQSELESASHKAWFPIKDFIEKVEKVLAKTNSVNFESVEYSRVGWLDYFESGNFEKDLIAIVQVLKKAQDSNQSVFTYSII